MVKTIVTHFKSNDPILYEALIKVYEVHGDKVFDLKKSDNLFFDLCESIVSQQLSVKAADSIFARVLDLMPAKLLTPQNILKQKDESLRKCGLSNAKVKYIKD